MRARPLLRGRDEELEQLEDAIRRAKDENAVSVLLGGEAGIGKTAVLDALMARARDVGFTVRKAKAQELELGRPFGLIRRCLDDAGSEMQAIDELLIGATARRSGRGWIEQPELQFRVIDHLVELVEREAAEAPIAIVLDDCQWADHPSLTAVAAILNRLADRSVLLLAAERTSARASELERLLGVLPSTERIMLQPLDGEAVTELVADVTGSRPGDATMRDLAQAAGNPFFVRTLIDAATATASHPQHRTDTLPTTIQRAVLSQFEQLSDETREVVRLASVFGSPFTWAMLAELSDRSGSALSAPLEEALRAQVLVDEGTELSFRHDLWRECVYDTISPAIRAGLHLEIGHRLLERKVPAPAVAAHFMRGAEFGDVEAVGVLRRAAAELGRVAPAMAVKLLERAAELLPDPHPDRLACLAELIQAYVFTGELDRSRGLADEQLAAPLPPDLELDLRNARSQVFFLRGDARRAAEEFEAMVPLATDEPREAVLLGDAAISAMFAIDIDRARTLAERSLAVDAAHGERAASALANAVLAWLTAFGGDLPGALRLADRALAAADDCPGLEGHRRIPHLFHSQVLLWADQVDDCRSSLQRGRAISADLGMGWDEPMYQALLADERIRSGEWDDALAEAEAGLDRAAEVGSYFAQGWLYAHQARVLFWRGQFAEARQMLDLADATEAHAAQGADLRWHLRGLLSAAEGDDDTALIILATLWEKLDDLGMRLRQLEFSPDVTRFAVGVGATDLETRVLTMVKDEHADRPSALTASMSTWCQALRTDDPTLAIEAVDHMRGRQHVFELARCQADAATILRGTGRTTEADALLGDATRVFTSLGATLPLRHHSPPDAGDHGGGGSRATTGWDSLTKSEKKVCRLVSEGLTNAEIADALSISRRTVESHLYHAYPKLGMTSRVELAVYASRR